MAMIDFPDSPLVNDVFDRWQWDGIRWIPFAEGGGAAVSGSALMGFHALKTTRQVTTPAQWPIITFDQVAFNDGGHYDPATSRWFPPPGKIVLGFHLYAFGANEGERAQGIFRKNGTLNYATNFSWMNVGKEAVVDLVVSDIAVADDFYEIMATAGLAATGEMGFMEGGCWFWGYWVGPP